MDSIPKASGVFFVTGTHGLTRIVRTRHLQKRWSEWQLASPFALELVGMITNDETALAVANTMLNRSGFLPPWERDMWTKFCQSSEGYRTLHLHYYLTQHFGRHRLCDDWYGLNKGSLHMLPLERP